MYYDDDFFLCMRLNHDILHFQFENEALHELQYWQHPPLHGQMQKHGHKPIAEFCSQMTGLLAKIKCNSEKWSNNEQKCQWML